MKFSTVIPYYKQNVIENYGKVISSNKLNINDGLSYTEHNESVFKDLEMTGGDIVVNGNFLVDGRLFGSVRDIVVTDKNSFYARELAIATLRNLKIGKEAWMYSPNSFSLTVENEYQNAGILASGGNLSLYLKKIPQSRQDGLILGKGEFCYKYERNDHPINHKDAPNVTSDPTILQYLRAHEKEAKDPKFFQNPEYRRMVEDFYKREGYEPKPDETTKDALTNLGNNFARTRKITIYIDHYLNTIIYHYVTYMPSGVTVLERITETGYIFQRREMLEKEIAGHMPPAISEFLDELNQEFQSKKDNVENKLKHAEEKNKRERARLSSEKRLNILRELSNTSKIDDYEQFCKELLSSGKFSGAQAQKLSELLENSELRSAYSELVNANNKLITMAEKLENLNLSKHKLNKFLNNTLSLIEQHRLEKERDGLVRNCLLYATKFRNNVNDWAVRNPLYADMAELVMDGIGYTVAIVGTIATASALVASAEISVPMAIGSLALKTTRKLSFKYGEQKLIELSSSYGMTEREVGEFRETTAWIIGKAKNMVNIITLGKTLKNTTKPFEDFCKTKLGANKLWQYRQISNQISKNTTAYIAKQRSQMLKNILTELAK